MTPAPPGTRGAGLQAATGSTAAPASHQILGRRRAWALVGVMLVQFISIFSSTAVANAAPTMVDELHGVSLYAWVFGGYTLAATVCVPVVGKLSDLLGRRVFYLVGLTAFITGSVVSALAQNMPELIAARVVAGAGGGAMLALTGATIGDIFPPRERAKWMGLLMANYGMGSMLGPVIGGVVTDQWGWRWTFVVTVPFGLSALALTAVVLPRVRRPGSPVIDWAGIGLLTGGLVGLLTAVTVGGVSAPWTSPGVLGAAAAGAVLIAVFVRHERRTAEPVISPDLFRSRVFITAVSLSFLIRMVFFGVLAFFPVYLQGVQGQSAQGAGLQLLPIMGGFILGNVASGQIISRSGRYTANAVVGPLIVVAGMAIAVTLTATSSVSTFFIAMALLGVGVGIVFPLPSTVVQSAFPYRILGAANSSRQFFDNLGQIIGVSVMTTLTIGIFTANLSSRLPSTPAVARAIDASSSHGLLSSRGQAGLAAQLGALPGHSVAGARTLLHESLAVGLRSAFVFALVAAALGILVGTRVPPIELRTTHE